MIYFHSMTSFVGTGAGWSLWTSGWKDSLRVFRHAQSVGINRIMIRGPEGQIEGWPLDFYMPSRFSKHIRSNSTRAMLDECHAMGLQIIPYFGSLSFDAAMMADDANQDAAGWIWKFLETIRPWTDAGCKELAFDHIGAHGLPTTPEYHALRLLQQFGIKVYGEPHGDGIGNLQTGHDLLDGVVVTWQHWTHAQAKYPFVERWKKPVVAIAGTMDDVVAIRNAGYTPAINYRELMQLGK
jgi:hypothetical protein